MPRNYVIIIRFNTLLNIYCFVIASNAVLTTHPRDPRITGFHRTPLKPTYAKAGFPWSRSPRDRATDARGGKKETLCEFLLPLAVFFDSLPALELFVPLDLTRVKRVKQKGKRRGERECENDKRSSEQASERANERTNDWHSNATWRTTPRCTV